jgi:hypothetical protein
VNGHTVSFVRMEWSDEGGRHGHVEGVCTPSGMEYTRAEIVDSLRSANVDRPHADNHYALFREILFCSTSVHGDPLHHDGCGHRRGERSRKPPTLLGRSEEAGDGTRLGARWSGPPISEAPEGASLGQARQPIG